MPMVTAVCTEFREELRLSPPPSAASVLLRPLLPTWPINRTIPIFPEIPKATAEVGQEPSHLPRPYLFPQRP